MTFSIDCSKCSFTFNPNSHYNCPSCGVKADFDYAEYRAKNPKDTTKRNEISGSIIIWIAILAGIFWFVVALMGIATPSESQSNGYDAEWNADNSIEGPAGTFDNQSKP